MKLQDCFLLRPNLRHLPVTDFDGTKYVGQMAIYVPEDNNSPTIRLGGHTAKFGDLCLIRGWDPAYNKDHKGNFRVGPLNSIDPKDFRDTIRVDEVFVIPVTEEQMIAEYNRLVEASEELDNRIAWMEAHGKKDFSENEYKLDCVMANIDIDLPKEKELSIRELIKKNVKF